MEQNYEYDLVNTESLLKRYIDKDVRVVVKGSGSEARKVIEGKLSAAVGPDLILQTSNGIEVVGRASVEEIALKELPEDLVTRPTLVWLTDAQKAGDAAGVVQRLLVAAAGGGADPHRDAAELVPLLAHPRMRGLRSTRLTHKDEGVVLPQGFHGALTRRARADGARPHAAALRARAGGCAGSP